jgi:hypothetical protein
VRRQVPESIPMPIPKPFYRFVRREQPLPPSDDEISTSVWFDRLVWQNENYPHEKISTSVWRFWRLWQAEGPF